MKTVLAATGLALWAGMAGAQDAGAIEDTIGAQLEAFNDRDIAEAWGFASPMIQGMFGNPGNFGRMVQNGYPMVWDNSAVEFRDLEGGPEIWTQDVYLRGPDGAGYVAEYDMIETDEGWKINGVRILPAPDVSA